MDDVSRYRLVRVDKDGSEEFVGGFTSFGAGWSEGQRMVHEDLDNAYRLYEGRTSRAWFGRSRMMVRSSGDRVFTMVESL